MLWLNNVRYVAASIAKLSSALSSPPSTSRLCTKYNNNLKQIDAAVAAFFPSLTQNKAEGRSWWEEGGGRPLGEAETYLGEKWED